MKSAVRAINTCGKGTVMRKIVMDVYLKLHYAVTLPTLLYNCETWPLNAKSRKEIDKMELWAWKNLLGLPKTTPTPALLYATGAMYCSIRVQSKQLIYLHRVLQKEDGHWTKDTLVKLHNYQIGWAKQVCDNLTEWELEEDWDRIKEKSRQGWQREVETAAEKVNRKRMLDECHKKERGEITIKTKTKRIVPFIESSNYNRHPEKYLKANNKLITRAYIMGRYGMLQCAANFKGQYGDKTCKKCLAEDNENHRINVCPEWSNINLINETEKLDFDQIHSENEEESLKIVKKVIEMWDLGNNKNTMKT